MQLKLSIPSFTPAARDLFGKTTATVAALNLPELAICATDLVTHGACGPLGIIEGGLGAMYMLMTPKGLPFLKTWGMGEVGKAAGYGLMAAGAPGAGSAVLLGSMLYQSITTARSYTAWKMPSTQPDTQVSVTLPTPAEVADAARTGAARVKEVVTDKENIKTARQVGGMLTIGGGAVAAIASPAVGAHMIQAGATLYVGATVADDPERARKLAGQAVHLAADAAIDLGQKAKGPALRGANAVLAQLGMELVPATEQPAIEAPAPEALPAPSPATPVA